MVLLPIYSLTNTDLTLTLFFSSILRLVKTSFWAPFDKPNSVDLMFTLLTKTFNTHSLSSH